LKTIRPIATEVETSFPACNGSAGFSSRRDAGDVTSTLRHVERRQKIDAAHRRSLEALHAALYNFRPSPGRDQAARGPGRREIATAPSRARRSSVLIPDADKFPYTSASSAKTARVERLVVDAASAAAR